MASEWREKNVTLVRPDLSRNISLDFTIGYTGEQCYNNNSYISAIIKKKWSVYHMLVTLGATMAQECITVYSALLNHYVLLKNI